MAGEMGKLGQQIVNKIALRDQALAKAIRDDVAGNNRDKFMKDTDQAKSKGYVNALEYAAVRADTKFNGEPVVGIKPPAETLKDDAGAVASSVADALGKTFLGPLFQANLWLRVGEVVLGVLLIAIGVVRMAPTSALVNKTPVGRIAKAMK
jgi:hypothetical protein